MKSRYLVAVGLFLVASAGAFAYFSDFVPFGSVVRQKMSGKATVADRLNQYGAVSRAKWARSFEAAHLTYPPQQIVLLGLKQEKTLEIYARNSGQENWKFVATKPIVRASGKIGPKLREGDMQVPEGFYRVESLNPNSAYHLALRVSYPNEEDRQIAASEQRDDLGGNIMIHGGNASIGCLAMGDEAAQDLFVLAAETGMANVQIVICPLDFREDDVPKAPERPQWLKSRYAKLREFTQSLPKPHS